MIKRRKPIRLSGYDYSSSGWYFVTVCTQDRKCIFGNIQSVGVGLSNPNRLSDPKMQLNENGKLVDYWWNKIPNRYSHVKLDVYQIMPNHIHGIIVVRNNVMVRDNVGAGFPRPNQSGFPRPNQSGFPRPSLGQIIAFFKYQSTKQIHIAQTGAETAPLQKQTLQKQTLHKQTPIPKIWQRNYYEHIIRNEFELFKIRQYIKNNPYI